MIKILHLNTANSKQYKYLLLCFIIIFNQKIAAINYYVNDVSLNGDIYTKAIGNDNNDGLSPNSPKLTLSAVYQKAKQGDVIYVDYGNYKEINSKGELLFDNKKKIRFVIAGKSEEVFTKTPFPENEKIAPDVFYIRNDKPISRQAYLNDSKEK